LLFALVGVAALTLPQAALAHGTVKSNGLRAFWDGRPLAIYRYKTTEVHHRVCVAVILQRRPGGGGAWVKVGKHRECSQDTDGVAFFTEWRSQRNCHKDYRLTGRGVSFSPEGGPHLRASKTKTLMTPC
jgi:hypothetical protein